jgi:hypothetical protein
MTNLKNIMIAAWKLAKRAQAKFGGNVKEFLASSLVIVWANAKKLAVAQAKVSKMNIKFKLGTKAQKDFALAIIERVGAYSVFTKKMIVDGKMVTFSNFEEAFAAQLAFFKNDAAICINSLKDAFYSEYKLTDLLSDR